ncbi:MAG: hypothetical protein AB8H80_19340 [Planctomycetota bacterium]
MASSHRPCRGAFRYLREPLCWIGLLLYVANTLVLKPWLPADQAVFVHGYLGDVLCMPVCVPVTLWLHRAVGGRNHDRPPTLIELAALWLWWSCCFEWLGPRMPQLAPGAVADPWDLLAYAAGGGIAAIAWRTGRTGHSLPRPRQQRAGHLAAHLVGQMAVATVVAVAVLGAYWATPLLGDAVRGSQEARARAVF